MKHEAFVYKWTNTQNGKFYIGKHKGNEDDGYISSGKAFLAAFNTHPSIFKREILFVGTNQEVLDRESELIQQAITSAGYDKLYNLTTWKYLKEWKRTCLHCGKIVDPRNTEWLQAFEQEHFENCKEHPINKEILSKPKPKLKPKLKPKVSEGYELIDLPKMSPEDLNKYEYLVKAHEILLKNKNTMSNRLAIMSVKKRISDLLTGTD